MGEVDWQFQNWGPRIIIHILNSAGDLREVMSFRMDDIDQHCHSYNDGQFCKPLSNVEDIEDFLISHFDNPSHKEDIVIGFTVGFVEMTQELADFLEYRVEAFENSLTSIVSDPIKSKYSQLAFITQGTR